MVNIFDDTKTEDFITKVKNLIDRKQIEEAFKLLRSLDNTDALLIALQSLLIDVKIYIDNAIELNSTRALALILQEAFQFPLEPEISIDRDHILGTTLALDFILTRALDFILARALNLPNEISSASVLELDLDHKVALTRARDRVNLIIHNLDLDQKIAGELNHARDFLYTIMRVISLRESNIEQTTDLDISFSKTPTKASDSFILTLTGIDILTPYNLGSLVSPYLQAIFDLQHVISDLKGESFSQPRIVSISQNSPFSIELTKIPDAIKALFQFISPTSRKIAKQLQDTEIKNAQADVDLKEIQILEAKGREKVSARSIEADIDLKKADAELKRAQAAKIYSEIENANIETTLSIIKEIAPSLSETERIKYLIRLLPLVNLLIESPLEPQKPNKRPK